MYLLWEFLFLHLPVEGALNKTSQMEAPLVRLSITNWVMNKNVIIIHVSRNKQRQDDEGISLNPNLPFFFRLNTSIVFMKYQPRQCNASYDRAFRVDWNLSAIITLKLFIRESELPQPAASSILFSQMMSSSVIIPYAIIFSNIVVE